MQSSSLNDLEPRRRRPRQLSTGSRPDALLRGIPTRLRIFNKVVHALKRRLLSLGDACSRGKATADSAEPLGLQFRFPFTPSTPQHLVNRISSLRTLKKLPDPLRGVIFRPPAHPVFRGEGRTSRLSLPPSASTWASTPPPVTLRLPHQLLSSSRVFEKDSTHTGFEPLPRR